MLLVMLEITHPFLANPIRVVNDNKSLVSNTNTFLAMPFKIQRQSDIQGELPKVTLTVSNIGRTMVKWVDSSGGASGAGMALMLARRSTPDLIEETLNLGVESVTITTEAVTFNLVVQNNLVKRAMRFIYDINRAQGLF